jgi:dTDP-4-dehydrorhamnose reductase
MSTTLLTGASGQLGGWLLHELRRRGLDIVAWGGPRSAQLPGGDWRPVDLADAGAVAAAFREARPTVVLHAAAVASVAECYRDPGRVLQINAAGTAGLADLAAGAKARLLLVSTDLVFDGEKGDYEEGDAPSPLSAYGRSKLEAERAVLGRPRCAAVRVSLLYGRTLTGRPAFFDQQLQLLRSGRTVTCFADEWRTPLDLKTAAAALVDVAHSDFEGPLHVGGPERLSRLEMGRRLAAALGVDPQLAVPTSRVQPDMHEPRPRDTSLRSARWRSLFPAQAWPTFEEALAGMSL